ncbi:putative quercetin-3-sulfate 4'-sulfotransferase [Helianthus anomalus]
MSFPTTTHALSLSRVTGLCIEDPEDEKANLALILDRYKGSITSLPKEKGWLTESLYMYQGHWFPSNNLISIGTVMASQEVFQANPTDIYLVTPPKSGTTWLKALAFAILNRKRYTNISTHPLLIFNPQDCLPYIENEILRNKPTYMDANSTRLFATHMPYTSLPQFILDSRCRLVYMCRNPKDVLVFMFHFVNKLRDKSLDRITLEEAFEMFSKGITPCGPYWDHVKGYHAASVKHPTQVLFLPYENMKMDTANNVRRLADFLGYPFTVEEEAKGAVQEIVSLCSFKNLTDANRHGNIREGLPKEAFFREGKVGDWSKHLTNEMSQILDGITKEKFNGLDISF